MTRYPASICMSIVLSLIPTFIAQVAAQESKVEATRTANADLKGLSNDELVVMRDSLEEEARKIDNTADNLGYLVTYAQEFKSATTEAERRTLRSKIAEIEPWAGIKPGEGMNADKNSALWTATQTEKNTIGARKKAVDSELAARLAAQAFKSRISLGCAGIITVVVIGFFWTASRSSDVISKIFGGEEGLQFITLFSMVVAIILFGVTGVLEGKELSALLGGLAGYILGRSSGASTSGAEQIDNATRQSSGMRQSAADSIATPGAARAQSASMKTVIGNGDRSDSVVGSISG